MELDSSFIENLPICTLSSILSNEHLRLASEDYLYNMIRSRCGLNDEWFQLLCHVRFEYLSKNSIESFISLSENHFNAFLRSFCLEVWQSICIRLSQSVELRHVNIRYGVFLSPNCDGSLEGIICYLTGKHGGNVEERGIVAISSSSYRPSFPARHVADLQTCTYFESDSSPGPWLCYDFKNRRVQPTHYSISAHSNNYYLRSWVLEGSLEGSKWDEIDRHTNDATTNTQHPIGTFNISKSILYRYIRLRQTGKNAHGTDHLIIYAFEIFGRLIE
jgi:hypothetical protein